MTLKLSVDWSTDEPLYTSQYDMMVANRLDTKGLHLDSEDTPRKTTINMTSNYYIRYTLHIPFYLPIKNFVA